VVNRSEKGSERPEQYNKKADRQEEEWKFRGVRRGSEGRKELKGWMGGGYGCICEGEGRASERKELI